MRSLHQLKSRPAVVLPLLAVLLCALSYAAITASARYRPLEANGDATAGGARAAWQATSWGVQIDGGGRRAPGEARLLADGSGRVPFISRAVPVPSGADGIRVGAALRAAGLRPGSGPWQEGRFQVLTYARPGGLLSHWPKGVAQLPSTRDWRDYEAVIPAPPGGSAMVAVVYNGADAGTLYVRDVEITAVKERLLYRLFRWGLIGAWVCLVAATIYLLLRPDSRVRTRLPLFGLGLVVLASVLIPQPFFAKVTAPLDEQLQVWLDELEPPPSTAPPKEAAEAPATARESAPPPPEQTATTAPTAPPPQETSAPEAPGRTTARPNPAPQPDAAASPQRSSPPKPTAGPGDAAAQPTPPLATLVHAAHRLGLKRDDLTIKAAGHAAAFFLVAVASFLAFPQIAFGWHVAALLVFAVSTEALQLFVITRTARVADLWIDAMGIGFGCAAGWVIVRLLTALRAPSLSAAEGDATGERP